MKRGDIFLARLEPAEGSEQRGTRPVVVVSRDSLNSTTPRVTVVPFATYRRQPLLPYRVLVEAAPAGLAADSVALCEQVRILDKARLLRPLGTVTDVAMEAIADGLRVALGLGSEPPPR